MSIVFLVGACNPARRLADDEVYLRNQDIDVRGTGFGFDVSKEEMEPVLKTKPNRRILLFFKFHLWAYNLFSEEFVNRKQEKKAARRARRNERRKARGKDLLSENYTTGWGRFKYEVGEPPAVFDSSKAKNSVEQLEVFLAKEGYFNNQVEYRVQYSKQQRRAKLTYIVTPNQPYRIRNIDYQITDESISRVENFIVKSSNLDSSAIFKVSELDAERERITEYLNNRGYYRFSKDFIVYRADSTEGDHQVDIDLIIRNIKQASPANPDSLIEVPHTKYYIENVYVHTDYNPIDIDYTASDTVEYRGVYFLFNNELEIRPEQLFYNIFLTNGDLYQKDNVSATYRRLTQLGVYRSVNIQFQPKIQRNGFNVLETHIYLSPAKRQTLSIESKGTHREGILGVAGNLGYLHKNVFGGGEALNVRLNVGFEAQQLLTDTETQNEVNTTSSAVQNNFDLNTFEIGPEVSLRINRLFPLSLRQITRTNNPTTTFSGEFNYQARPDYERTLTQFRMNYAFTESEGSTIYIDPIGLSVIKIQKSQAFQDRLDQLNDQFLLTSYQDHLIASTGVSWVRNSQKPFYQRSFYYNKISGEVAGNLLRGLYNASAIEPEDNGSFEILDIQFAQYWKLEEDFRYYRKYNDKNTVVYRIAGGIGQPLPNLSTLPFEKAFFAGGANGIRAWQARTLGPGSYQDTTALITYNNIGEIKILGNVEYRFKLTNTVEGALFLDAGNIWLIEDEELRPGSGFSEDFYTEIAVGSGIGVRLDFDFFLIRFDFGIQLKDPAKIPGERWIWQPKTNYNDFKRRLAEREGNDQSYEPYMPRINFSLGIGYPF